MDDTNSPDEAIALGPLLFPDLERDLPERVFHFTDVPGFTGIVEGSAFWASLATAQNDLMEITHGTEFTRVFLDERRKDLLSKRILEERARLAIQHTNPIDGMFVVAFCEEERTAHHWLHYGHHGTGFALGFDRQQLADSAGALSQFMLEPVLYTEEDQSRVLGEYLDTLIEKYGGDEKAAALAPVIAGMVIPRLITRMKRPEFHAEREWRLLGPISWMPPDPDREPKTEYRASAERIIPYRECGFEPGALREVVIGSSSRVTVNDPGLRMLLRDHAPKAERRKSKVWVRP